LYIEKIEINKDTITVTLWNSALKKSLPATIAKNEKKTDKTTTVIFV
jgi:hypothetical protein